MTKSLITGFLGMGKVLKYRPKIVFCLRVGRQQGFGPMLLRTFLQCLSAQMLAYVVGKKIEGSALAPAAQVQFENYVGSGFLRS